MTRRIGGKVRDDRIKAARAVPRLAERALAADVATNATNATNAVKISTEAPKVLLEDDDLVALVTDDGGISPVTIGNLLAFLESRYVLTPIP